MSGGGDEASNAQRRRAEPPSGKSRAHRRIVDQHVANGLRLLVLRLLRRVARLVERRVHHRAIAEQAELAAGRDLAAGIGRRQVVDHRLRRHGKALHLHRIELQARPAACSPRAGPLQRDRGGVREAVGKARASQQRAERLIGCHRSDDAGRRCAAHEGGIDADLQARLTAEGGQAVVQGLGRDVEALRALARDRPAPPDHPARCAHADRRWRLSTPGPLPTPSPRSSASCPVPTRHGPTTSQTQRQSSLTTRRRRAPLSKVSRARRSIARDHDDPWRQSDAAPRPARAPRRAAPRRGSARLYTPVRG